MAKQYNVHAPGKTPSSFIRKGDAIKRMRSMQRNGAKSVTISQSGASLNDRTLASRTKRRNKRRRK